MGKQQHLPNWPTNAYKEAPLPPNQESTWYLGLDWGTTGLSATFLHGETGSLHPVYLDRDTTRYYRFAYQPLAATDREEIADSAQYRWLQEFKRLFAATLGGYAESIWELQWQWSSEIAFSLEQILEELTQWFRQWLATIQTSGKAVGLDAATCRQAWSQVAGVVVGTSYGSADAYRFHLREVLLGSGLVDDPRQIFFVEDAVATLASQLPNLSVPTGQAPTSSTQPILTKLSQQLPQGGMALVVNSGELTTELALVSVPENYEELTHEDFSFRSFTYGGRAIDQDTVLQVLLDPTMLGTSELAISEDAMPEPGQPDRSKRDRLMMQLRSCRLGIVLLDIAADLKKVLPERDSYWLQIGSARRQIQRRDLESRVFVPFVQQLNRELNALFSETGISVQAVRHAICTGGNASSEAIGHWLRHKLPNATIVQDVCSDSHQATYTRVACGLATIPLYPQLLARGRAQYSDYFLLWELLDVLTRASLSRVPKGSLTKSQIFQWLEQRGIPISMVRARLEILLNNQLPPGLFPDADDEIWLTPVSRDALYQLQVRELPLFYYHPSEQTYRLNLEVATLWRKYFHSIIQNNYQKLKEPLPTDLYSQIHAEKALDK